MIQLNKDQIASLKSWFLPERPGSLAGLHVVHTGHGFCWADRWPHPRALLLVTGPRHFLTGEPDAFTPADLERRIDGIVEMPESFVPLLRTVFPGMVPLDRVALEMFEGPIFSPLRHQFIRRLHAADTVHLERLRPEIAWIATTWGGFSGLASSRYAWGAFADGRLVSVACSFMVGERYEDLAVVTEPEYRGLGLSAACAAAACTDIISRGRQPAWAAFSENVASLRVAEKVGFSIHRLDRVYMAGLWRELLEKAKHDLASLIPNGTSFILVDECQWGSEILAGRHAIPFLERDGQYWGNPPDDSTAIRELERLRQTGASFIVFASPAFWWLQHYAGLQDHLSSNFRCILKNSSVEVFDMRL